MVTEEQTRQFLMEFQVKRKTWGIFYRDVRTKNGQALADLEIRPFERDKIIEELVVEDYSEGPMPDVVFNGADMWVFGKRFKNKEIYIKVTMGWEGAQVICISFHTAEHNMSYPFKKL